jgi:elongation factor P hydroxylase
MIHHHYQDLIKLFHHTFFAVYNTCLELGNDEPVYHPADSRTPYHRIVFAHGFYASALHEIAH